MKSGGVDLVEPLSPLPFGNSAGRGRTVSFDTFSSPVLKHKLDPIDFQTPQKKPTRNRADTFDDDISTAAPSPWAGGDMDSPWCSPSLPGGVRRESFHFPKGGLQGMPRHRFSTASENPFMDMDLQPGPPRGSIGGFEFSFTLTEPCGATTSLPLCRETAVAAEEASLEAPTTVEMTPPTTPRKASNKENITPPATPRKDFYCPFAGSPPPPPKAKTPVPSLVRALQAKNAKQVGEALFEDAEAACFPLWDHEMEPPLCFALKQNCSAEIVRLLLQAGADPDLKDLQGRGAADTLRSVRNANKDSLYYAEIEIIAKMLGVGPDSNKKQIISNMPGMIGQDFTATPWLLDEDMTPPWANADQYINRPDQVSSVSFLSMLANANAL